jgi:EmrB/QacA subfamily drug resistance transporter
MERKWWTLITVNVATFMLLLDITIVNVALPSIRADLNSSFTDLQWVVDAYSLSLAAFVLTAGSLADRLGRRRIFAIGLAVFTVASLLCALSPTATALNLARGLQGVGGAVMFAVSLSLIAQEFHGKDLGMAMGTYGATIGGAVAIGPLVGGLLTDSIGWQAIFYLNLPIGIAAIFLTLTRIRESRDPAASRPDWPGLVAFSSSLFLLVFALLRGNDEGWGSPLIVGLLAGAGVLMAAFVVVEQRVKHPMLELPLFRKGAFTGTQIGAFAISGSMFALFLYLTLYMQNILGLEPLEAGVRFLPITIASFFAAAASGALISRFPVNRVMGVGLVLVGAGLILMAGIDEGDDWTTLLAGFIVGGVGIGTVNPAMAAAAVGVVPPERSGMASGINDTFRQVGIATGIAGLGALFQARVETKAVDALGGAGLPSGRAHAIAEQFASGNAETVLRSLPADQAVVVGRAANTAFIGGLNEILVIGAILAAAGGILALVLLRGFDLADHPVAAELAPEPTAA